MRSLTCLSAAALALGATTVAGAQGVAPPPFVDGTILDVSAEGTTSRVPDVATIRAGVVTQGLTASAALAENATRMARVFAALKAAGVAPRDIRTANVSLTPQYRYVEGQSPSVTGYQASNSVAVRFRDIVRSGAILDASVREGANQIDGPSLALDQPDAALDEARVAAVRVARARADLYARAAGLAVARILSISESAANDGATPPPLYYARSAGVAAAPPTQVSAGQTEVSVTLSVRFLLK